jgi:hypothetical protein
LVARSELARPVPLCSRICNLEAWEDGENASSHAAKAIDEQFVIYGKFSFFIFFSFFSSVFICLFIYLFYFIYLLPIHPLTCRQE